MPVPLEVRVVRPFGAGIIAALKVRPELRLGIKAHQLARQFQCLLISGEHVPVAERARRVPLMVEQRSFFARLFVGWLLRGFPAAVLEIAGAEIFLGKPAPRGDVGVVVLVNRHLAVESVHQQVDAFFPIRITRVLIPRDHGAHQPCLTVRVGVGPPFFRPQPGLAAVSLGRVVNAVVADVRRHHAQHACLKIESFAAAAHDSQHGHGLHRLRLAGHQDGGVKGHRRRVAFREVAAPRLRQVVS